MDNRPLYNSRIIRTYTEYMEQVHPEIDMASILTDAGMALKQKFQFITEVRGRGLLVAIEFSGDIAGSVLTACLDRGLLVNRVKPNALRFMPPLIIGNKEVDEALDILDKALSTVAN